jgi:hypothetical protein
MKNILPLKTILAVLLAALIMYLMYGLYQRSNEEEERQRRDAHRIETMILEKHEKQP